MKDVGLGKAALTVVLEKQRSPLVGSDSTEETLVNENRVAPGASSRSHGSAAIATGLVEV
jgi:hypothetical protein